MLKPILNARDPSLREVSIEIKKSEIKRVSENLKDTLMHFSLIDGVGLSAIQIGESFRIFVVREDQEKKVTVIANPKITHIHKGPLSQVYEGCLSLPGAFGYVNRPTSVMMNFLDEKGKEQKRNFTGLLSTIALHEYDHLNGVLFIDRAFNREQRRDFQRRFKIKANAIKDDYYYE